jgi:protein-L-isoaspartate(D-aspartate) O-methyltransferase
MKEDDYAELRKRMVQEQIASRGIRDPRIIASMEKIPRHLFVPENLRDQAYEDSPLPIGEGQTISQPYIVAWMTSLLEISEDDRVLEVGSGSGYQTAVLCELAGQVYTIEMNAELAARAEEALRLLGYKNFAIRIADGTRGWPEEAPFNGVMVTAGAPSVPQPLLDELADGGRMVIPVGSKSMQMLTLIRRKGGEFETVQEGNCAFVPLLGEFGWQKKRML